MIIEDLDFAMLYNTLSEEDKEQYARRVRWVVPATEIQELRANRMYGHFRFSEKMDDPKRYSIYGKMEDGLHGIMGAFCLTIYQTLVVKDNEIIGRYEWNYNTKSFDKIIF